MATGTFTVDAALQLDQLSMVMMMIVTGVGFLIHVFSVGYMKEDPGYPRYFAYSEPLRLLHARARDGRELRPDVRGAGKA